MEYPCIGAKNILFICFGVVFCLCYKCAASPGESQYTYKQCFRKCQFPNCYNEYTLEEFVQNQTWSHYLLQWTCVDECKYKCMWETVDEWRRHKIKKHYKFYGKWSFISMWGMQEPASTIFSILHGCASVVMLKKVFKTVPRSAPMFWVIVFYSIVCINAWIWSTAYHARDINFLEKMDYYAANAMILYSLFTLCARLLTNKPRWVTFAAFTMIFIFFCRHVYLLHFVSFNYSYNMTVMAITGILNSIGWSILCRIQLWQKPYVNKAVSAISVALFFMLFELYDFPPILGVFDAHSIWHGGTIVVPVLFYNFLIEDAVDMMKQIKLQNEEKNSKNTLIDCIIDCQSHYHQPQLYRDVKLRHYAENLI